MTLVLDGSAAIAWCFEDESTPAVDAVMRQVALDGAFVPTIWRMEVANALLVGVRRGRITAERRDIMLDALMEFGIQTVFDTDLRVWPATTRLAERHDLTVYDASYLELARRMAVPLATLDKALLRAAPKEDVELVSMIG